jgi:hypothetical protein
VICTISPAGDTKTNDLIRDSIAFCVAKWVGFVPLLAFEIFLFVSEDINFP